MLARLWFYCRYIWQVTKTRRTLYVVGVGSCFVALVFFVVAQTILQLLPFVTLALAQHSVGQTDVVLYPANGAGGISYSKFQQHHQAQFPHSTPRIRFHSVGIYPQYLCTSPFQSITTSNTTSAWAYERSGECDIVPNQALQGAECIDQICTRIAGGNWEALLVDDFPPSPLHELQLQEKIPEFYASADLAMSASLVQNDVVTVRLNVGFELPQLFLDVDGPQFYHGIRNYNVVYLTMRFAGTLSENDLVGMAAASSSLMSNSLVMDIKFFFKHIGQNLSPRMRPVVGESIMKLLPCDYATSVVVNMPLEERLTTYVQNNIEHVQTVITDFATRLSFAVGFSHVTAEMPILEFLLDARYMNLFLYLIVCLASIVLGFFCMYLVFSFITIDLERQTTDLKILQIIGFKRRYMFEFVFCQAVFYLGPALVCALVVCQFGWFVVFTQIQSLTPIVVLPSSGISVFTIASVTLLVLCLCIGLTLFQTYRCQTTTTTTTTTTSTFITGMISIVLGFLVYYGFPLALLTQQIVLLLSIFFIVLIGMLCGCSIIILNLDHVLHILLVKIMFVWELSSAVKTMVMANLTSHRHRNRKTTFLYVVSLGFVILFSMSITLIIYSINYREIQAGGADFKLLFDLPALQNRPELVASIEHVLSRGPSWPHDPLRGSTASIVDDWAWLSHCLHDQPKATTISSTSIGNPGKYVSFVQTVYGVSPGFYRVALSEFLQVSSSSFTEELAETLYRDSGLSHRGLIGSLYKPFLGDGLNVFVSKSSEGIDSSPILFQAQTYIDASPRFVFSQYPHHLAQDMAVSFPTMIVLSGSNRNSSNRQQQQQQQQQQQLRSINDVAMKEVLIRFRVLYATNNNDDDIKELERNLVQVMDATGISYHFWKLRDQQSSMESMTLIVDVISAILIFVAMFLCGCLLSSNILANITEHAGEISALRGIGCRKSFLVRVFLMEAVVHVQTALILGMIVGYGMGTMMAMQQALILELPLFISFPWKLYLLVACFGLCTSIVVTVGPLYRHLRYSQK